MAERTVNSVTSALTGKLTSRVFSRLIQRYSKHSATPEKLQQLEMLLIKIHSAVEASENRTIENSWLLRWRDNLKEAAKQGDEVLASFQQWAKDAQATKTDGNQQQGEAASSSAAAPATAVSALSFTRNSLPSMVQGIRCAREMLFSSGNDDMENLNKAVELADRRDLKDLEWLAYWAGILRLAKELGRDVLDTTRSCKTSNVEDSKESTVECDQDKDELSSFVLSLEGLAKDVEYFSKLVYLCPVKGM